MRFLLQFKTTDVLDQIDDQIKSYDEEGNKAPIDEDLLSTCKDVAGKWIEYSEYIKVEIDTETKTIKVVENKL